MLRIYPGLQLAREFTSRGYVMGLLMVLRAHQMLQTSLHQMLFANMCSLYKTIVRGNHAC
jgi:hypothetical protein